MDSTEVMALISGKINEEILLRNEYLAAENIILRSKIKGRLILTDQERRLLAKIGKQLGVKALTDIGPIFQPDTILRWYRELIAKKFDGSKNRKKAGRPRTKEEIEELVIKIADENLGWGYDRIVGALYNLGIKISDSTVGEILKRNGIFPSPKRKKTMSWAEFIKSHEKEIVATDFFTTEVLTSVGLITYYILFFIHIGSRKVYLAGITDHPNEAWMRQIAINETMEDWGFLSNIRYLIHDRDSKFSIGFREIIKSVGIKPLKLPARSPNLNAFAERWVLSIKTDCLSKIITNSDNKLWDVIEHYIDHYHEERNHQGKGNIILFPNKTFNPKSTQEPIEKISKLGGLLNYYYRKAS